MHFKRRRQKTQLSGLHIVSSGTAYVTIDKCVVYADRKRHWGCFSSGVCFSCRTDVFHAEAGLSLEVMYYPDGDFTSQRTQHVMGG
jgi:hypothetical protein